MRIVNPSVEIMRNGLEKDFITPEQFIEKVGRTCYKSEDKITDVSAAKFVSNLIKRGHEAMIEHWNLIFQTDAESYEDIQNDWLILLHNGNVPTKDRLRPYLRFTDCTEDGYSRCVISGNMRAWRDYIKACDEGFGLIPYYLHTFIRNYPTFFPEYQNRTLNPVEDDVLVPITVSDLVGDVEKGVHWDVTVKFICDRGVSHEIVRHRTASFAQESTRYCNYGLGKFDKCITVVEPQFIKDHFFEDMAVSADAAVIQAWEDGCVRAEAAYFKLLELGCTPQEARSVLPNSLKTEIIVTMNRNNWKHFFDLRCAPDAHPDIQVVAKMTKSDFDNFEEE